MALSARTRVGPYEVLSLVGSGGMGEVYRARDTTLGRDVALKVLLAAVANDPERLARFRREAQLLAALNHPHIAQVHGFEEADGLPALIMEFVEGPTLADLIGTGSTGSRLPLAETIRIARQIADALEAAHEQGIIHRDLKPANIKVRKDGTVKVLDFGLAKALASAGPATDAMTSPTLTAATEVGVIVGTAAYMSPEQARGKAVDRRADVWAFGVIVFEMLTGVRPFAGETVTDALASVVRSEPDWQKLPASTPPAIRRLLWACLAKDRSARLQAIGDARFFFEDVRDDRVARPAVTRAVLPWAIGAAMLLSALASVLFVHLRERVATPDPSTFTIPPPEKTYVREAIISPDGRRLVFSVSDQTGQRRLWIRHLNALVPQSLAGTEGAVRPFWSPDSRFVGFFVGTRLFKVDVAGASTQFVTQSGETVGATWARDGTIIFARNLGGLFRVAAAGGSPQQLTKLDPALKESRHYWPTMLPGDRHFLYVVTSTLPDAQGVWVASLTNPTDRHRLLGDVTMAAYSSGRLLFARGNALMAQPFDSERLTLGGEPVPVFDHIDHFTNTGFAAFSASENGTIAAVESARQWRLAWHDRTGRPLGAFGKGGRYQSLSLSPDETRVAVDADSDLAPGYQLNVIDEARGTTAQLTFGNATGNFPLWSPDGARLAFASNRDGVYDIYVKPSTGAGSDEVVLKNTNNKFLSDWSRDGRYLIYGERPQGSKISDLWVLPMFGNRQPVLYLHSEFDLRDARFSPDSRWVAYVSDESSTRQVYVQSFPPASEKIQISNDGGTRPRWRIDGRELYYMTEGGTLMAVKVDVDAKSGSGFSASAPTQLFQTWLNNILVGYAPSRDGQRFVMLAPDGESPAPAATIILNWADGRR